MQFLVLIDVEPRGDEDLGPRAPEVWETLKNALLRLDMPAVTLNESDDDFWWNLDGVEMLWHSDRLVEPSIVTGVVPNTASTTITLRFKSMVERNRIYRTLRYPFQKGS